MSKKAELSAAKAKAAAALIMGKSQAVAGKWAGRRSDTVSRWYRKDEAFRRVVDEGRMDLLRGLKGEVMSLFKEALGQIRGMDRRDALEFIRNNKVLGWGVDAAIAREVSEVTHDLGGDINVTLNVAAKPTRADESDD